MRYQDTGKMHAYNAIYFLFILGCYIADRSSCLETIFNIHSVTSFQSLLLEGCNGAGARVEWTFDNNLLFLEDKLLVSTGLDHIKLLSNNSVYIEEASIKHGGTYNCTIDSTAIVSHVVNVQGLCCFNIYYLNK